MQSCLRQGRKVKKPKMEEVKNKIDAGVLNNLVNKCLCIKCLLNTCVPSVLCTHDADVKKLCNYENLSSGAGKI